ncbi:MAG: hypothetical protein V3S66_04415 [Desulfobacterales bacterium]
MKKLGIIFVSIAALLAYVPVYGADNFTLEITSEGQTYNQGFSAIEDAINNLDTDAIEAQISNYTDTSAASGTINFRGLKINLSVPANSTAITIDIPSINVNQTFTGATRDASVDQLEDWLKKEAGGIVTEIMQWLAANSATDPIAGNPVALQSTMAAGSYDRGFTLATTELEPRTIEAGEKNGNLAGVGFQFGYFDVGDSKVQSYTVPLSYTIRSNTNARKKFTINMPITITDLEGANSYSVGLGGGLTWPITDRWALTPAFDYGFMGSIDLGSVGQIISPSLTSSYSWPIRNMKLNMGNMIGYMESIEISFDEYSFDPGISNTVFRNGLMLYIPTDKFRKNTGIEVFITDTRFTGNDLYIDSYNEIGFSWGSKKIVRKTVKGIIKNYLRDMRAGLTFTFADDSEGISFNFGYTF